MKAEDGSYDLYCDNEFCPGPARCRLRQAVEFANDERDLVDHWKALNDRCPITGEMYPDFQGKSKELKE